MPESLNTTTNELQFAPFPECYPRVSRSLPLSSVWVRPALALLICFFSSASLPTFAQAQTKKPKVTITSPKVPAGTAIVVTGNVVYVKFAATSSDVTQVKFRITTDEGDAGGFVARVVSDAAKNARYVPLFKGANTIELYAVSGDTTERVPSAKLAVACNDPSCYTALPPTMAELSASETPSARNVTISRPADGDSVTDVATIARTISVQKVSGIKKLTVDVTNGDKTVDHKLVPLEDLNDALAYAKPTLKLAPGRNVIRVYSLETLGEKGNQDSIEVTLTCSDAKCGKEAEGTTTSESAKKSDVKVLQPTEGFDAGDVSDFVTYLSIAKDSKISKLQYEVFQGGKRLVSGATLDVPTHAGKEATLTPKIKLWQGDNTIRFFDPTDPANAEKQAALKVTCSGVVKCLKPDAPAEDVTKNITVDVPASKVGDTYHVTNRSSLDSMITVAKGNIKKIQYDVISSGRPIWTSESVPVDATEKAVKVPLRLKFVRGLNTIRVYDSEHPGGDDDASVMIDCTGDNCATDLDIATIVTTSQNTRVVVGFEQAGGSSTESTTKPFLDLYLSAPFIFDRQSKADKEKNLLKVPRVGTWGQIRLASTPEQLTNISVLPSNLVNQLVQTDKINNLVQSFDFLAGLEARIFTAKGSFLGLIPGVRQKTRFYLAGGYGAISPLSVTAENVRMFKIPPTTSPQYQTFIERYGPLKDPVNQTKIAFVPLDRDRFLRQWYVGIRTKTYYCEDEVCEQFKNRFPGILDIMYGQSEAVTGGSRKYQMAGPSGTKSKNAFVLRIDGFYPLPFKDASFLFLYGTAMMKIGGLGTNITTPLILDPILPPVPSVDDASVFIPSLEKLLLQQPNRDYYKIGVGVNLTELFNRNKTPPQ